MTLASPWKPGANFGVDLSTFGVDTDPVLSAKGNGGASKTTSQGGPRPLGPKEEGPPKGAYSHWTNPQGLLAVGLWQSIYYCEAVKRREVTAGKLPM